MSNIEEDKNYLLVVEGVKKGIIIKETKLDHPAHLYRNVWDRLSIDTDSLGKEIMVLEGCKIVIPEGSRKNILQKLHLSHSGIVKTKQNARQLYFWHGMNNDIENMVKNCEECFVNLPCKILKAYVYTRSMKSYSVFRVQFKSESLFQVFYFQLNF